MFQNKVTQITTEEKTPTSSSGGFLFDLALPPLAVILVGFVMICILSQITFASTASQPGLTDQIAPLFTPEVQYWAQKIVNWSLWESTGRVPVRCDGLVPGDAVPFY